MTDKLSSETLAAQALGTTSLLRHDRYAIAGWAKQSLKRYDLVGRRGLLREHLGIDELAVLGLEIRLGDPTGH